MEKGGQLCRIEVEVQLLGLDPGGTASCLTCTLTEVLVYVEREVTHHLGGEGISSVGGIRRDDEVRVAEKTLTKLPVKEALPGWVIKRRGRVVRGE